MSYVKTSEDMFKLIEIARQEELARLTKDKLKDGPSSKNHSLLSKDVTKQKVREMLERKKREMILKIGTNSSAGSSLKDTFLLERTEVPKGGNYVFISDEENELGAFASK